MSRGLEQEAPYRGVAFFSMGFRPFFLSAALFAGMAVPLWVLMLNGVEGVTVRYSPRWWHVHEMVFGFLPAVILGFLLTAIPNWIDRPPLRGAKLAGLWVLWVIGRVVIAVPWFPPLVVSMLDGAFLVTAAGLLWREIITTSSWKIAPMGVLVSFYALANLLFHVLTLQERNADFPPRMALAVLLILLVVIGGRIVPNFTEEFFEMRGRPERPSTFSRYDGLVIAMVVFSGAVWVEWPYERGTGWLFVLAGLVNAGRLVRWKGWLTWPEPLVLVLHVGYGWVAAALLLVGGSLLGIGLPPPDALHALTAGAVGIMTLGVMTRASLGHTGRPRHAGPLTVCIYLMAFVGALIRVFGPSVGLAHRVAMGLAAISWSGAYLLFAAFYGPFLLKPSVDE